MVPSSVIMTLLVAATALVDLGIYLDITWGVPEGSSAVDPLFIAGLGQVVVLLLWVVFGRTTLAWRILAVVSFVCVWASATSWISVLSTVVGSDQLRAWRQWQLDSVLPPLFGVTTMGITLAGFRLAGMEITESTRAAEHQCDVPPRWQFTVRNLFTWITATALVLTVLRLTIPVDQLKNVILRRNWQLMEGSGVCVIVGIAAGGMAWVLLGTRWPVLRALVLAILVVAAACLDYRDWNYEGRFPMLGTMGWAMALLAVTRIAGHRMSWHAPRWVRRALRGLPPRP